MCTDAAERKMLCAEVIAATLLPHAAGITPRALVILGSGLQDVVERVQVASTIPFTEVPGFPPPTVTGHAGRFVFGSVKDVPVLMMQGRIHYYEGHPMAMLASYVRAAQLLGATKLVVTNAAGAVSPDLKPGTIMLMTDHLNMMFTNPLIGPNVDAVGPRLPSMVGAYTPALRDLAH